MIAVLSNVRDSFSQVVFRLIDSSDLATLEVFNIKRNVMRFLKEALIEDLPNLSKIHFSGCIRGESEVDDNTNDSQFIQYPNTLTIRSSY